MKKTQIIEKLFDVVSLDLFDTLVYIKSTDYDPWSKLDEALFQSTIFKKFVMPKIPVDDVCNAYYSFINEEMKQENRLKEFQNNEVLLDIWRKHGVKINITLKDASVQIIDYYFNSILPLMDLFDEVHEVLKYLRNRGYTLVLSSNHSYPPNGWAVLEKFNLSQYFHKIVWSGEIGWKKPSIAFFHYTFEGLADKDRIIHVGDDLKTDIVGANNYGIKALWIRNSKLNSYNIAPSVQCEAIVSEIQQITQFL